MKCPKCGYNSFDHLDTCRKCQASLAEPRTALGLTVAPAAAAALEAASGVAEAPVAGPAATLTVPKPAVAVAEPDLELDPMALDEPAAPEPEAPEPAAPEPAADGPALALEGAQLESAPEPEPDAELTALAVLEAPEAPEAAEVAGPEIAEMEAPEESLPLLEPEPEEAAPETEPDAELPPELAALMKEAEASVDEEPEGGEGASPAIELDEDLAKFLEQEGTSLEELTEGEELAAEDEDDDQTPPPEAGGGGAGGGEVPLKLDGSPGQRSLDGGEEGGGSRSACQGEEPRRAPFWMRGLALGVDAALLSVLGLALLVSSIAAFLWATQRLGPAADPLSLLRLALVMTPVVATASLPMLSLAYFSCFHGLAGRTPGKMLVGLEVRQEGGGRLGCGRAFLRTVGYFISALPLALGFFWATGHERLAWHDLLAGSEVLTL